MKNIFAYNPSDRVKLVNGRFADVHRGRYFPEGASLVLQNGKIAAIPGLPGEPAEAPADAVIDLGGRYVIPGLFNTHSHLQIINGVVDKGEIRQRQIAKNLADCLERGVTNVRDTLCWDLRQNQAIQEKLSRGELRGPRLHQAIHVSPLSGTYAPVRTFFKRSMLSMLGLSTVDYENPYSGAVVFRKDASEQEVRDAVDRAISERGAQSIKFCDQPEHFMSYKPGASVMAPKQLEAAVNQARKRGLPTTIHNVTREGFRQSLRFGMTSLAHLPFDQELNDADLQLFAGSESIVEPTLTVAYYMSWNMQGNRWRGHPEINRLDKFRSLTYQSLVEECWLPEVQQSFIGQRESLRKGSMKLYSVIDISGPIHYYAGFQPIGGRNFQKIYAAGGRDRMACGNDATVIGCSQAAIHLEMELFDFCLNRDGQQVFCGADALSVATIHSARALGLEESFGSIDAGKVADLIVLDGDPLQDWRLVGSPVQALFMDGQVVINRCGLRVEGP